MLGDERAGTEHTRGGRWRDEKRFGIDRFVLKRRVF
jgi:hypothetical protein